MTAKGTVVVGVLTAVMASAATLAVVSLTSTRGDEPTDREDQQVSVTADDAVTECSRHLVTEVSSYYTGDDVREGSLFARQTGGRWVVTGTVVVREPAGEGGRWPVTGGHYRFDLDVRCEAVHDGDSWWLTAPLRW